VTSRVVAAVFVIVAAASCGGGGDKLERVPQAGGAHIDVRGPWADSTMIPVRFTCDGEGAAPTLEWDKVGGSAGYAIVVLDPDAPGGVFVHWTAWNIPAESAELPGGELPDAAAQGPNSFGGRGYGPPCPPAGDDSHRYRYTVYALRDRLDPPADADIDQIVEAISGAAIAQGTLVGTYAR
jgi:Raf kinase inhibitor-like YbhB/YbcL family protein